MTQQTLAATNCAKCGAPLENPFECSFCGQHYIVRKSAAEPYQTLKRVCTVLIFLSVLSGATTALFLYHFISETRALIIFSGSVPVFLFGSCTFCAADFLAMGLHYEEKDTSTRTLFFDWLFNSRDFTRLWRDRGFWLPLKLIMIAVPLYLYNVRKPVWYGVAATIIWPIIIGVIVIINRII